MSTLLSGTNLTVERHGKRILDNVSLSIAPRDFITIIGPNGAGKSMLLKCLLGFYQPTKGQVAQQAGLRIGYVPQRMSVERTIPITVERFLKLHKPCSRASREQVIADTDISALVKRPLTVLSGGEMQRVLLARALLNDPQLLMLDEPAQNLDISGQLAFYEHLERAYQSRDMSVVMVSHDLHLVLASTQRVVCLYHHVCCTGKPEQIRTDPSFIKLFGNDMSRLMSYYQHQHDHNHDSGQAETDRSHVTAPDEQANIDQERRTHG